MDEFKQGEKVFASLPTKTRRASGTQSYWWYPRELEILAVIGDRVLCQLWSGKQIEVPVSQLCRDKEKAIADSALHNRDYRRGVAA